jgi:hypothetical protein
VFYFQCGWRVNLPPRSARPPLESERGAAVRPDDDGALERGIERELLAGAEL